jgi:hypothetical protein
MKADIFYNLGERKSVQQFGCNQVDPRGREYDEQGDSNSSDDRVAQQFNKPSRLILYCLSSRYWQ